MSVGIISNVISSYIHAYQARLYYMLDTLISILSPSSSMRLNINHS